MRLFHVTSGMLLMICGLALGQGTTSAPATEPAKGPLVVEAKPASDSVKAGETVKVVVTVRNVSTDVQNIDIPTMWWAKSDSPQATFPSWPARGGIGPVQIFKATPVDPGKTYEHTWEATISKDATGEVTFRVGIPLKRMGETVWSAPVVIKVVKE